MSNKLQEMQAHKEVLLGEKREVDLQLSELKAEIKRAQVTFRAGGPRANSQWLLERHELVAKLKRASQNFQDKLGELNRTLRANQELDEIGLDHFVHEVLLERLERQEVDEIFAEAIRRKRQHRARLNNA
jgi:uncharacterized protein YukE